MFRLFQADIQSREYLRVNFKPEGEQWLDSNPRDMCNMGEMSDFWAARGSDVTF